MQDIESSRATGLIPNRKKHPSIDLTSTAMSKDNTRYVFTLFSLTENELVCFSWNHGSSPTNDENNPGIVFVFNDDTSIHNFLMLPSVATVAGTWGERNTLLSSPQPGMHKGKIYAVCILMCLCVARGDASVI